MRMARRCTATSSTTAGCPSSRPCPISTLERMRSQSSTSSSRTRAGRSIGRSWSSRRPDLAHTRTRSFGGGGVIRFEVPLSGLTITLREPTGADDLLLAEYQGDDPHLLLRLIERLAEADVDWSDLAVFDIDTLILRLRQGMIGDRVSSHVACAGCGGRGDLSFGIETY